MAPEINTFEIEFVSSRRAWRLLFLLAILGTVWLGISIMLPHDRYIRYQQLVHSDLFRTRWVYERIHYDKTPIDVAIIGSSRVEASISAPRLEQELTERFGRPVHVANLAIPEEGRNLHYLIARELLENHPETRIILVSVVEQADLSHPAFRYLADARDLVTAPVLINHFYFSDAAFLPYRQMSYFFQTKFPKLFSESRTFRRDYSGTNFDTTRSFYLPSGKLVNRDAIMPSGELALGSRRIVKEDGGDWRQPSPWEALNNPLETEYTKRLIDEARSHCAEVVFVRLPFYNSPSKMYDADFYRNLAPLLDAQELSKDARSYSDPGHFNRIGSGRLTSWLWNALNPYLEPLGDEAFCSKQNTTLTACGSCDRSLRP